MCSYGRGTTSSTVAIQVHHHVDILYLVGSVRAPLSSISFVQIIRTPTLRQRRLKAPISSRQSAFLNNIPASGQQKSVITSIPRDLLECDRGRGPEDLRLRYVTRLSSLLC